MDGRSRIGDWKVFAQALGLEHNVSPSVALMGYICRILEELNANLQLAKKRARGYKNTDNLIKMDYFICGKLEFDYPRYLT